MVQITEFSSPFFNLVQVGEGLFAAIVKPGTGAMGNAAIIDLGDRTVVFDTFFTPEAAQDLRRAALTLSQREVTLVINSHWHGDHVFGNSVFPQSVIISTQLTRERMSEMDQPSDIEQDIHELTSYIEQRQKELDKMPEGSLRAALAEDIGDRKAMLRNLRDIRIVLPHITFADELILNGSSRSAVVRTYGGGHTHSDAFLWLPEDGVLFAGDLFVNRCHAWVGSGHVQNWISIIDQLYEIDFATIVPGHGDVGDKAALLNHRQYLVDLLSLANGDGDDVKIPARYEDWAASQMFMRNIEVLRSQK